MSFKGDAKAFLRTYNFLSTVLPYGSRGWEKRSVFLDHLVPKLPAPKEEDLSAGILENIDLESYRAEKQNAMKIVLDDEDGALALVPAARGGHRADPELALLSAIVRSFNDHFGNIEWNDADRVERFITEEIPRLVSEDEAYRNAQANDDPVNARVESDRALSQVTCALSPTTPNSSRSSRTTEVSNSGSPKSYSKQRIEKVLRDGLAFGSCASAQRHVAIALSRRWCAPPCAPSAALTNRGGC